MTGCATTDVRNMISDPLLNLRLALTDFMTSCSEGTGGNWHCDALLLRNLGRSYSVSKVLETNYRVSRHFISNLGNTATSGEFGE